MRNKHEPYQRRKITSLNIPMQKPVKCAPESRTLQPKAMEVSCAGTKQKVAISISISTV